MSYLVDMYISYELDQSKASSTQYDIYKSLQCYTFTVIMMLVSRILVCALLFVDVLTVGYQENRPFSRGSM